MTEHLVNPNADQPNQQADGPRRDPVLVRLNAELLRDARIMAKLSGQSLDEFTELAARKLVREQAKAAKEQLSEWLARVEKHTPE